MKITSGRTLSKAYDGLTQGFRGARCRGEITIFFTTEILRSREYWFIETQSNLSLRKGLIS